MKKKLKKKAKIRRIKKAKRVARKVKVKVKRAAKKTKIKVKRIIRKVRAKRVKKKIIKKHVKRTVKKITVKKVTRHKVLTDFTSANSVFKPKIRVIGIGGGGGSIVSEIGRSLEKASFVVADSDIRVMKKKPGIKYFYFGEEITHGLGTGMNPDIGKEAAHNNREKIKKILEGQDIVILVGALGGGLSSGAAPIFAEISRNLGNITLGIFTTPFKFEGTKKAQISHKAIKSLREHLNAVITIQNERIFKIANEKTSITEAFSMVNKNLIESLESLIDLIYNPGLINIDFADLRTTLKGRGMMAFLNTAEASGKDRSDQVVEKILSNPLFGYNIQPEKVLFNISGGESLSMIEVEKISRVISELNPKAKIIFGISKNAKAKGKIKTTLLTTGPSFSLPEPVIIKKEEKKRVVKKIVEKIKKKEKLIKLPISRVPAPIAVAVANKKESIRRSALEVRKAQDLEESKKLEGESEWEVPAFLRRMRFKT